MRTRLRGGSGSSCADHHGSMTGGNVRAHGSLLSLAICLRMVAGGQAHRDSHKSEEGPSTHGR